jgi:hypothetical protein
MVICNYRFGSNVCLDECHKTDGGRVTSKCKKHLNQAAKKSRKKLIRKIEFTSPRDALIAKATENSEAKKRTQRSRAGRQDAIETIQNDNVRRIATILNRMKDSRKYVMVANAVASTLKPEDFKLTGVAEPITFSNTLPPFLRTMQALEDPSVHLSDVLEAINSVFGGCCNIKAKLLNSKAGDTAQKNHTDNVPDKTAPLKTLSSFHYSALISLEENTTLLVGKGRKTVSIPLHSMIFFRGDMTHAGAGYTEENSRLFISVSSAAFPATEDVSLVN